ncbi:hypothetical protein HNY73_010156 [Argiope bruennichi]|uniref:Uncharacterized protein n=1 Tax=Argiope bruennichi TaxID=94029 RepID=A0A8T0F2C8_ARGBR|nr:hypothetical protein HNY73_010156 [Argiope bruennichi]
MEEDSCIWFPNNHLTVDCSIKERIPEPVCINCKGIGYLASWKGCPAYPSTTTGTRRSYAETLRKRIPECNPEITRTQSTSQQRPRNQRKATEFNPTTAAPVIPDVSEIHTSSFFGSASSQKQAVLEGKLAIPHKGTAICFSLCNQDASRCLPPPVPRSLPPSPPVPRSLPPSKPVPPPLSTSPPVPPPLPTSLSVPPTGHVQFLVPIISYMPMVQLLPFHSVAVSYPPFYVPVVPPFLPAIVPAAVSSLPACSQSVVACTLATHCEPELVRTSPVHSEPEPAHTSPVHSEPEAPRISPAQCRPACASNKLGKARITKISKNIFSKCDKNIYENDICNTPTTNKFAVLLDDCKEENRTNIVLSLN